MQSFTSSCFAAALDSTTLRQRECKTKKQKKTHTHTHHHHQQPKQQQQQQKQTEKVGLISKTTISLARASHIFCTFYSRFALRDYVVETPNFAFWGSLDNQRRNYFF